jgi:hypothetical protein
MSLAEPPVRLPPSIETSFDAGVTGAVFSTSGLLAIALGDGTMQRLGASGFFAATQVSRSTSKGEASLPAGMTAGWSAWRETAASRN